MNPSQKKSFSSKLCLLVEDQPQTCDFLHQVVTTAFPGMELVMVRNLREAQGWLEERQRQDEKPPLGLALVDLGLPDGSGLEIIRELAAKEPDTHAVVVTIYDGDAFLFDALAAGASGYLLKEEDPNSLIDVLKRVEKNEPPLSPVIAHRLLEHFRAQNSAPVESGLTPRERETLTLLARGLTVGESAHQMGLSPQTVAGYVKIVYQKLHVSNRAAAVREAIRRRLV
ncbi:MAG: response regulator transcription factor [Bdellovibrionaceae bacterium]|nr:response regulator transcription factor [Pseudobdellovibrionaceae bacterium]MBX3034638.1 response regulator transcription factor [Pseudobdellovibrionaceae bacterium]